MFAPVRPEPAALTGGQIFIKTGQIGRFCGVRRGDPEHPAKSAGIAAENLPKSLKLGETKCPEASC